MGVFLFWLVTFKGFEGRISKRVSDGLPALGFRARRDERGVEGKLGLPMAEIESLHSHQNENLSQKL